MKEWMLTSSVLILLVLAVRYLFKNKMKAKYTYALWLIVLVRLLCPVNFGELSFNLLSLAEEGKAQLEEHLEAEATDRETALQQEKINQYQEGIVYFPASVSAETEDYPEWISEAENPALEAGEVKEISRSAEVTPVFSLPEIDWQKVLPILWMAGMVLMAVVICNVNISFSTTLGMLRKELPGFAKKGWGKTDLSVYMADGINSSCLFGVFHPSIYLNKKGMNDREKKYCVEHEYSHYLQGDMIWSLCRTVCLVLHWYNPLVWLAVVLSKKDAELACDERTIARLGEEERYSYGHTLVELAAGQSRAVQMLGMATLMAPDKKEVVDRVKAITTKKETKIITGLLVAILLVGIGCFIFTGEAKGEQENNKNETTATLTPTVMPTATEVPVKAEPTASVEPPVTEQKQMVSGTPKPAATPVTEQEQKISGTPKPTVAPGLIGYVYARVPGTNQYQKEDGLYVKDDVTYEEIFFENHVELTLETGKGLLLDLDGDGTKEQLYVDPLRGVYINNQYVFWVDFDDSDTYLVMDIDTTDGMYELMLQNTVYYYNGTGFVPCAKYNYHRWPDGKSFVSGIAEFTRVDEHTIEFRAYNEGHHCIVNTKFVLDENHLLTAVEDDCYNEDHTHLAKEMYSSRKKESDTEVKDFREKIDISYKELSIEDHVELSSRAETGWRIDLNGDGIWEELCIYTDYAAYLCINGYGVAILDASNVGEEVKFWLLDIDTTDDMFEILTADGVLRYYDGTKLVHCYALTNYTFADGCLFQGNLREFTRVDEHTISYVEMHRFGVMEFEMMETQYRLGSGHGLELVHVEGDHTNCLNCNGFLD